MPSAALKHSDYVREDLSQLLDDSSETTGSILKKARQVRGFDLDRVSKTLRISESYLDALESDDRGRMPEVVYTIGFLRTYSMFLGLNADEMVKRFKNQFAQAVSSETLLFPAPAPERSIPSTTLVTLASFLALLVLGAWLYLRPSPVVIDEFQHLSPVVTEGIDTPSKEIDVASEAEPEPVATEPSHEAEVPPVVENAPVQSIFPVQETPVVEKTSHKVRLKENGIYLAEAKMFSIEAKADSWVEVRAGKGQVLISKVMKAGEVNEFPVTANMTFSTGNAGGITFLINGQSYSGLGKDAEVMKGKTLHFMGVPAEG